MKTRSARNEENSREREEGVEQKREMGVCVCVFNANSLSGGIQFGNGEGPSFPPGCFGSYEPFGVLKEGF